MPAETEEETCGSWYVDCTSQGCCCGPTDYNSCSYSPFGIGLLPRTDDHGAVYSGLARFSSHTLHQSKPRMVVLCLPLPVLHLQCRQRGSSEHIVTQCSALTQCRKPHHKPASPIPLFQSKSCSNIEVSSTATQFRSNGLFFSDFLFVSLQRFRCW